MSLERTTTTPLAIGTIGIATREGGVQGDPHPHSTRGWSHNHRKTATARATTTAARTAARTATASPWWWLLLRMRNTLALLTLCTRPCHASYTVTLDPTASSQCYSVRVPDRRSVISGNFDCWEEQESSLRGCRGILVWLTDDASPHTMSWTSTKSEDTFLVTVDASARYSLCFRSTTKTDYGNDDNTNRNREMKMVHDEYAHIDDDENNDPTNTASTSTVQVGFNLRVQTAEPRTLEDGVIGPEAKRAIQLVQTAAQTERQWKDLLDHFDFVKNREQAQLVLTRQIQSRVMAWTCLEAVLVISMAVGQVWYWKTFFEQRRFL